MGLVLAYREFCSSTSHLFPIVMARIRVENYQFCPRCRGPLEKRRLKAGEPEQPCCPQCGFILYLDPKVVVVALVPRDGGLLLLRQDRPGRRDSWVLPGGFVNLGESLEEALVREVEEETRLSIRVNRLLNAYSYAGGQKVVLSFITEYLSGDLAPGDETLEARIFAAEEIPWDHLGFRTTRLALQDYLSTFPPKLYATGS
jgi:ADP-ribose pyrophosphatase YjhB (NUDIX family)